MDLRLIQNNLRKVFDGIYNYPFPSNECHSDFAIVMCSYQKYEAIELYIETMIRIYQESDDIKRKVYTIFGCSFYPIRTIHYKTYTMFPEDKQIINTKIKYSLVKILRKSQCILLISFINSL